MPEPRVIVTLMLVLMNLGSCQNQSDRSDNSTSFEITQKDTTGLVQTVLEHRVLDSLLNFAFKDQTLKVVFNELIKSPLNLKMNGKPVEFTATDSSSSRFGEHNTKPVFFAKITLIKRTSSGVKLVIFFESIGLFGEYWLKKSEDGFWEIEHFNFAHT